MWLQEQGGFVDIVDQVKRDKQSMALRMADAMRRRTKSPSEPTVDSAATVVANNNRQSKQQ